VCFFYLKNLYTAKYVTTGFTFNLLIYLYPSKKNKHRKHGFKKNKKTNKKDTQIATTNRNCAITMANTYTFYKKNLPYSN